MCCQLATVKQCGYNDRSFYLAIGSASATGAASIYMRVDDLVIAQNMHTIVTRYVHTIVTRYVHTVVTLYVLYPFERGVILPRCVYVFYLR